MGLRKKANRESAHRLRVKLLIFFGFILIVSGILKLMMPSRHSAVTNDNKKNKINTYSQVDSILEFSNDFDQINHQNWDQKLKTFGHLEFHDRLLTFYAYGNLNYSLWKESLAARSMLLEIQNSLFLVPSIDRFFPRIPMSDDILLEDYNLKNTDLINFKNLLRNMYNQYKDKFHVHDSGSLQKASKNIFHNQNLANPEYFNFLANDYYNESLSYLTLFVNELDSLFSGGLKARARLALLYALKNDKDKINTVLSPRVLNALLDSLYQDNYALKIEVIELIVYLEKIEYFNQDDILKIYNNLNFEIAKALFRNKREILGMEGIDAFSTIDSTTILLEKEEDMIYYPEYIITNAEILIINNEIRKAEEIINELWFKDSDPIPPPHSSDWLFENYPEFLLKTIRLGYWDGARLPHYLGNVLDLYSQNNNYDDLRKTLKLFVLLVTEDVGPGSIYN